MKKGKIAITITIGIICFILVSIIFMQFKVVYQTDIMAIDTMREEDLKAELASWKSKYEEAEKKYTETIATLNKYQEESSSDSKTKKNLEQELENLKLMLGITDVEGPGIIITLKNPENATQEELENEAKQLITENDLMIIINYLKDAGAEAISINNQRIVNNTDIVNISSDKYKPIIKINSQRISSPFEIKVIGDADYLKGALTVTGFVDKIKGWGQEIKFEDSKKLNIKKYDGKMETKYIEN